MRHSDDLTIVDAYEMLIRRARVLREMQGKRVKMDTYIDRFVDEVAEVIDSDPFLPAGYRNALLTELDV